MELFDLIKKLRDRIEKYGDLLRNSEALTRYVLVDPMLRALGWDTENPEIVRPEERQEGGRPDYVLYHEGRKLIALEAKSLGTRLDEKKVLDLGFNYSWKNRIPYFIITGGNIWKVYDVKKMGGELLFEIDILTEPIEDVVRKLLALWRPLIRQEIRSVAPLEAEGTTPLKAEERRVERKIFAGPIDSRLAEQLVLYILHRIGRPMKRKEIVDKIGEIVELTEHDKEVLKSGRVRWETTVRRAVSHLTKEGYIERVEEGVWRITETGILKLKELNEGVNSMVKCPFCGYEADVSNFKLLKEPWKFGFYEVRMFECPKCRNVFNYYYGISPKRGKVSEFTIKVRPRTENSKVGE